MGTCRQWKQGNCYYGNDCRYAHHEVDDRQQHSARQHPYDQGKNVRFDTGPRQGDDGGHGPQRRGGRHHQQQHHHHQQQHQHQHQHKSPGSGTPLSPTENYPLPPPPSAEDMAQQLLQPQQQQPQQQQQQARPQQQPAMGPLARARAMCKLLGIGQPAPLVNPELEATAIKFFAHGNFFRETPFADSIEKFLPPLKQQQ